MEQFMWLQLAYSGTGIKFDFVSGQAVVDDELARTRLQYIVDKKGKFGEYHTGSYETLNLFFLSDPAESDIGVSDAHIVGMCQLPKEQLSEDEIKFSSCAITMDDVALEGGLSAIHESGHVSLPDSPQISNTKIHAVAITPSSMGSQMRRWPVRYTKGE
jgi:hypothetical protein